MGADLKKIHHRKRKKKRIQKKRDLKRQRFKDFFKKETKPKHSNRTF
jgi:hypothetical protein